MKKHQDVFEGRIEVPEIVRAKADEVFQVIREEKIEMIELQHKDHEKGTGRRYLHFFKSQTAAAACVVAIACAGITAAAAGFHLWSRGMQGTIQATPQEQQSLIDQGVAVTDDSISEEQQNNLSGLAVTDNDITVLPNTVIIDDRVMHISFKVQGYDIEDGKEPSFDNIDVYLDSEADEKELMDDGKMHQNSSINWTGGFYDGILPDLADALGTGTYEDGTSLKTDENGNLIQYYKDDEGNLEFVLTAWDSRQDMSLLGQKIHVDFKNLGTVSKAAFEDDKEGEGKWNFTIQLPSVSSGKTIDVGKQIEGTDFVLKDVNISPISIRLDYTSENSHEINGDVLGIPDFVGVVLKDGTRLGYLDGGNILGYTDESLTDAYGQSNFRKVIDPDQVAFLLIYQSDSGNNTEANLLEVPLN